MITRLEDFQKHYPEAIMDTKYNIPCVCCAKLGYLRTEDCCCDCYKCWNTAVQDKDKDN